MKIKRSEFIGEWIKALESGEYKQAKGVLRNENRDRFCCLGVACDVANKFSRTNYFDMSDNLLLPESLANFIGIDEGGEFKEEIKYRGKNYSSLTNLNDEGITFPTIARIIREQLEKRNFSK
jgi:hypothetical protein